MARSSPLEHVRKICLALPETNERASHGLLQMLATSRPEQCFVPPAIRDAHQVVMDKVPRPRTTKARRARST